MTRKKRPAVLYNLLDHTIL